MAHVGKTQLTYVISVPSDLVAEGDRLFASHGPWMESTHGRSGDTALLSYNVSKAPERSNPMDPNSAPTGNTIFVLHEIYESDAGVADHFEKAATTWSEFPDLVKWLEKCQIAGVAASPVINSLWKQ